MIADPVKMFTKEDFIPDGADKFLHTLAPFLALFPVMITFVVIPFGDTISIGGHRIGLQAANLNAGALYLLATIGIGVYGVALAGWASNNRWALLGGIRATAQMISYELAMGLAIVVGGHDLRHAESAGNRARAGRGVVRIFATMGNFHSAARVHAAAGGGRRRNPSESRSICPRASRN